MFPLLQKAYRGYKGRCKVPRRTLKRTRVLGPRLLVASRRFRAAKLFQARPDAQQHTFLTLWSLLLLLVVVVVVSSLPLQLCVAAVT